MSSGLRATILSVMFSSTYLALIASVVYFYWGVGLSLELNEWRNSLLPTCLVFVGVFALLTTTWKHSSDALHNSKRLAKFMAPVYRRRGLLSMLLAWEIVSATYLLVNLGLISLGIFSLLSPFCVWEDCVFYTLVFSQLASSLCAAAVAGLTGFLT